MLTSEAFHEFKALWFEDFPESVLTDEELAEMANKLLAATLFVYKPVVSVAGYNSKYESN